MENRKEKFKEGLENGSIGKVILKMTENNGTVWSIVETEEEVFLFEASKLRETKRMRLLKNGKVCGRDTDFIIVVGYKISGNGAFEINLQGRNRCKSFAMEEIASIEYAPNTSFAKLIEKTVLIK